MATWQKNSHFAVLALLSLGIDFKNSFHVLGQRHPYTFPSGWIKLFQVSLIGFQKFFLFWAAGIIFGCKIGERSFFLCFNFLNEQSMNYQWILNENSMNTQWILNEHSVNTQWTLNEKLFHFSLKIEWTLKLKCYI